MCNKAHLVAQGYAQIEGVDLGETFAPIARLEAIRLLLRFSCICQDKLYQMDVKRAFLNGLLNEDMFPSQRALLVRSILNMFINYVRPSMNLNKLHELSMNNCQSFFLSWVIVVAVLIKRCLLSVKDLIS